MARINPVTADKATGEIKQSYATLQKNMGGKLYNIFQSMGNSGPLLKAFMAMSEAANQTSLSQQLRTQISLAVGQANQCQYCLSAHNAQATAQKLPTQQIMQARKGEASDPKTNAILHFSKAVIEKRGKMTDQDITALKSAGVTDKELAEIILVINLNMFTNYFNNITNTPVDFPEAPKLQENMAGTSSSSSKTTRSPR